MPDADPIFHGVSVGLDELDLEWREPVVGFEIEPRSISVTRDFQEEKLAAAGLDPAVFGDSVDPSFFIGIGIQAGIRSGIRAEGNVNMVQRLSQSRPVRLGETLTARGRIERVCEVPRGWTVETTVVFEDASGEKVVDASRTSLKPDPERRAARGAGERPPPVVEEPLRACTLERHVLTPDGVKAYSSEGNSIHYDEAAARAAGFRAPLIGGGMGVHFLTAPVWRRGTPRRLDLSVYFRRPIFWDERFTSAVVGDPEARDTWSALCLLRDEGEAGPKVLTEARIDALHG